MLAIIIGIIAPPKSPWTPLNNVIARKLSEKAQPMLEKTKPDRLIKKKILVDNNLINQPLKGIIITSVINEADITYEISSMLAFSSPCKYFKEEPTIWTLNIFKTKPLRIIKKINNFFFIHNILFYFSLNNIKIFIHYFIINMFFLYIFLNNWMHKVNLYVYLERMF